MGLRRQKSEFSSLVRYFEIAPGESSTSNFDGKKKFALILGYGDTWKSNRGFLRSQFFAADRKERRRRQEWLDQHLASAAREGNREAIEEASIAGQLKPLPDFYSFARSTGVTFGLKARNSLSYRKEDTVGLLPLLGLTKSESFIVPYRGQS